jgi:hypothetical protein
MNSNWFLQNDFVNMSKLILELYKHCLYVSTHYFVSDEITAHLNVLVTLMEHRVGGNV